MRVRNIFHLLGVGVLRLVRMMNEWSACAAHVGERRQLDGAALEELAGLVEAIRSYSAS